MLGPSESALINLGARFPPCMKSVQNLSLSTLMPCTKCSLLVLGSNTDYFGFKVSMTRQTHQLVCAPSKMYVALEGSMEVFQTNGSGKEPLRFRDTP